MPSRQLVQSKTDVVTNFETLVELRESPDGAESGKYLSLLRAAKVVVVAEIDGKREYGPSRFVGYRRNSLSVHFDYRHSNDGRETTPQLARLFKNLYYADPVEEKRFKTFCRKHGIKKDFQALKTPIKFIFADYKASPEALLTKPRHSNSDNTEDNDITLPNLKTFAPLNQILFGPPGTGKTYHTTARAVALLEGISDEELVVQYPVEKREELRQKFEDYRAAGRIAFVTFHQAFTYEDFVEGIKPLPPTPVAESDTPVAPTSVQYDVQPGIFRRMCETAATAANTTAAPPIPAFSELYDEFVEQLRHRMSETRGPLTFSSKTGEPMVLTDIPKDKPGRLTFLHGNSGQQDHHIDKMWVEKLYKQYESIDQIKKLKQDITDVVGGSNATLMWVVFNELKKYEAEWLAQAREQERQKQQNAVAPPFVLIIDEINRGNVANIFGELITLLEEDKRAGQPEAVTVQLPYSKKPFNVPENLYILGTMNTADKSVEALDAALRRRFSFTEMLPRPELLDDVEGINLRELLTAINARLEQLLDHDHCIGHALLMRVTTLEGLREAFRRNILPLLQEYFFGDWGKIGLVVGGAFIQQVNKSLSTTGYKLMPFGSYSVGELSEKPVYKLTQPETWTAKAFTDIYAQA